MLGKVSRGDTIIEVLVSFAVFSLVVVSAIIIMNQGVAAAQRSLEITLVRQQIDSQVAMIQRAQQYDLQTWKDIRTNAVDTIGSFSAVTNTACPDSAGLGTGAFFVAATAGLTDTTRYGASAATYQKAVTYARADVMGDDTALFEPKSYGLWATLVKAENFAQLSAYDLHIRACWDSVGTNVPVTIATVVRLYDTE